jgi:hypothetical protein
MLGVFLEEIYAAVDPCDCAFALADQEFLHGGHQGLHGRLNQLELLERWTMQDKIANLLRKL